MIYSRYNVVIPDETMPGFYLIYNTLSQALYQLEPEYYETLTKVKDGGSDFSAEEKGRIEEMASVGYIAENTEEENEKVIHRMNTATYGDNGSMNCIVVTTMACNLACKYCIESGMDNAQTMSMETAQKVADDIIREAEKRNCKEITIDFYGGEPLMNKPVIIFISEKVNEWCEKNHARYGFTMTSNGTLLTKETVEELKKYGFGGARITIDGVKEVHDARRPFRSGKGSSFDTIVKNIEEVGELTNLTLINVYSKESLERFEELLDELEERGILKHFNRIQLGPETPYLNENGSACGSNSCILDRNDSEVFMAMQRKIVNRGLSIGEDILQASGCAVVMSNSLTVYKADGDIHRCPALMGLPEMSIGHVDQESRNNHFYKCCNQDLWKKCLEETDCQYLPMCGVGLGCRFDAYCKTGNVMADACSKDFFDVYCPEAMKMEYQLQMQKEAAATASNNG